MTTIINMTGSWKSKDKRSQKMISLDNQPRVILLLLRAKRRKRKLQQNKSILLKKEKKTEQISDSRSWMETMAWTRDKPPPPREDLLKEEQVAKTMVMSTMEDTHKLLAGQKDNCLLRCSNSKLTNNKIKRAILCMARELPWGRVLKINVEQLPVSLLASQVEVREPTLLHSQELPLWMWETDSDEQRICD
jgi:hypothetical protein